MGAWHTAILEEASVEALRSECIRQHDNAEAARARIAVLEAALREVAHHADDAWGFMVDVRAALSGDTTP